MFDVYKCVYEQTSFLTPRRSSRLRDRRGENDALRNKSNQTEGFVTGLRCVKGVQGLSSKSRRTDVSLQDHNRMESAAAVDVLLEEAILTMLLR
ncbi:hypothetical protein KOW79_001197 [Hemibagrus wyckioides]|uniref:Uncharacterized protein n=1 Tax=Hemibagrus wyckioides TaxID=337641 RepID=A0A9D3P4T8_9TELE|nr:hypothetical protein KOW79_001197 [Hemibagrus wyckioides]